MDPADRRFFSGIAVALFALATYGYAVYIAGQSNAPARVTQPSVPSLIPPPLSCLCGTSKVSTKPFSVVCPYCRNTLSVQPSAADQATGAATGFVAKPAK